MVKVCNTAFPKNHIYEEIFKYYPFELSDFQKWSICAIHEKKNVLITAQTGSGKTLPAAYAIKYLIQQGKRVIYTTPLKALTNQKTNDFRKKFSNISFGTITGDIKFNTEAQCLLMTTEILRNTLFQQRMIEKKITTKYQQTLHFDMNMEQELGAVIFDEVHYINDTFRGSVVEETIMMLPKNVILIMLSATVEPAERLANWVEKVTERETWWAPNDKRVVPLTHYSFLTLRNALSERHRQQNPLLDNILHKPLMLRHANERFQDTNYHSINKIMSYFNKNHIFVNKYHVLNEIVGYLKKKNLLPAICFVLSRKKCNDYAHHITHSLHDGKTMNIIKQKCKKLLIDKLPNYKEYIQLPEYSQMVNLLMKGIAIHHSGVHPILREMVELMFENGGVKLLFATETFSAGINVPAKTVLFTGIQKFDGRSFRFLLPHEYTQMAGRAGRRGIDDKGVIIHLNNLFKLPSIQDYRTMLCGSPQKLDSKFKLSFQLILQLIATKQPFQPFIANTMLQDSIEREVYQIKENINILEEKKRKQEDMLQLCQTPKSILETYINLESSLGLSSRKSYKKIKRDQEKLRCQYKHLIRELPKIKAIKEIDNTLVGENKQLTITLSYVSISIDIIIDFLLNFGFITQESDKTAFPYALTARGKLAANIQEVNALVFSQLLENKRLNNLHSSELAAIFSCFANLSIPRDQRTNLACVILPSRIKQLLHTISDYYRELQDIEIQYHLESNEDYDIKFEFCTLILDWCSTVDEKKCKDIINRAKERGISIGEFTKAILKINKIADELGKVCLLQSDIRLLNMLKKIPMLTLKSIATNQSLYI